MDGEAVPVRASVALAAYNGERYLREQVDSILRCLSEKDELVISCDKSTDRTEEIAEEYARQDPRVRVLRNQHPGVQGNFNNAVEACRGKYIFLSDQDDVWTGDKVEKVVSVFEETGADMVMHDGYMTDAALNPLPKTIFERYGTDDRYLPNLIRCTYWGCCMAFRSGFRRIICPFPTEGGTGHDLWISLLATRHGKIARCNEVLTLHRLHGDNQSAPKRRPLPVILRHRINTVINLKKREWALKKAGLLT